MKLTQQIFAVHFEAETVGDIQYVNNRQINKTLPESNLNSSLQQRTSRMLQRTVASEWREGRERIAAERSLAHLGLNDVHDLDVKVNSLFREVLGDRRLGWKSSNGLLIIYTGVSTLIS